MDMLEGGQFEKQRRRGLPSVSDGGLMKSVKTVTTRSSTISFAAATRWLGLMVFALVALSLLYWSSLPAIRHAVCTQSSVPDLASGGSVTSGGLKSAANLDPVCDGKRIYMHKLPPEFNDILVASCAMVEFYEVDMCRNAKEGGFGPLVEFSGSEDPLRQLLVPNNAWYQTEQFYLEHPFHTRMKHYRCLTEDPEAADGFFVPYYGAIDLIRYLFSTKVQMRDRLVQRLVGWLQTNPYWNRRQGKDHFFLLGRIAWDFCREVEDEKGWGSCLLRLPELKNATKLSIETKCGIQVAVPYPTPFHPRSMNDIQQWQAVVRQSKRPYKVSFTGMPRVGNIDSTHPTWRQHVRELVLSECEQSPLCKMFECRKTVDCTTLKQHELIGEVVLKSVFCLQPPGDSPTRKATFDSLLGGCIPVFVSPDTAYTQYLWHLPADRDSYSVFFEQEDLFDRHEKKADHSGLLEFLASIPEEKISRMRETIVTLTPQIVYADGRGREEEAKVVDEPEKTQSGIGPDFKDAFAIIIETVTQELKT